MKKIILAILSFYPILYSLNFLISIIVTLISVQNGGGSAVGPGIFAYHLACIVITILMVIYYLLDTVSNPNTQKEKTGWIVALIFLGMLSLPFYWYFNIYKEPIST